MAATKRTKRDVGELMEGVSVMNSHRVGRVVGPFHDFVNVCLKVGDGIPAARVGEIGIIGPPDRIQHDGSRTEAERDAIAHKQIRV